MGSILPDNLSPLLSELVKCQKEMSSAPSGPGCQLSLTMIVSLVEGRLVTAGVLQGCLLGPLLVLCYRCRQVYSRGVYIGCGYRCELVGRGHTWGCVAGRWWQRG